MKLPRRRPFLLTAMLLLLLVAVPASAHHHFSDVPNNHEHHDAISAVREAGITIGCRTTSVFCPNSFVRRGQMATFLDRGLPKITADSQNSATTLAAARSGYNGVSGVAAVVDVETTGERGSGSGYVTLQGSVSVYGDGVVAGCPCEVEAYVLGPNDRHGPSSYAVLSGQPGAPASGSGPGKSSISVPVDWTLQVPTGRQQTYRLAVFVTGARAGDLQASGTLTAITAPMGQAPTP
ncbi:S-layer homology domain-containing protein [Egicoccus sp. AB-alg2]|uniref:S-layer homology domain-containing protein n=1 Tax=Egicoccus sp. AB-alg2 TaxID=3242693 RepID=UPI00359DC0BA